MAYFSFTRALVRGEPIELFNGGALSRDFTYIDDIVGGVVSALEAPVGYTLYNLGRGAPVELRTFVRAIEDAVGKQANIAEVPMQAGDVHATYADTSRAREALGYAPSVTLAEGIPAFVKWYRGYYNE
jgi:UDP-glucuronate 4-epimerase